ncbi:SDR family oxidoreductase [Ornithinibacillus halophilus]|uniref:Thioester reductase domain-containing protein n=1 Tax=Ornithinibacillus halophilus TaxID=930117 RepID=A0A1M5LZ51_9BACI|nr:SDR family oxidoreductase [Ornithinibacillus halophilus]SHG70372.1 Thioester reductase domain-containing protein [Ornithinibacillus halophilus]
MNTNLFLTGYPGFLASSLIEQLLHDHHKQIDHIYLLVLPNMRHKATEELKKTANDPSKFTVVTGDITQQGLGIETSMNQELQNKITHVFHLAAIYDLAVPKDIAYQVNVLGTNNVNTWVKELPNLQRYIYFSTAYVSGKREGKIYEHELEMGQSFKNHYEQTKYMAEVLVEEMKDKVPTTIIRPGVVKGHSKTGYTIKFDGLYFMLNMLDKLRFLPFVPYIGDGEAEGNFVPADYVLQATSYLSIDPIGEGKTYHLTDPKPYKMWELQKMLTEHYLGTTPKGKIPLDFARTPLRWRPIRKWLQAEPEAMDYFTTTSSYDCSQTVKDLEGSGITCPDLKDTLKPMVYFYRKYKDDFTRQIEFD